MASHFVSSCPLCRPWVWSLNDLCFIANRLQVPYHANIEDIKRIWLENDGHHPVCGSSPNGVRTIPRGQMQPEQHHFPQPPGEYGTDVLVSG